MHHALNTHLDMHQDLSDFPDAIKTVQGMWYVENYGAKNSFRAEPFHHLDIAAQFIRPHKKNKRFESIFEVSIYNVYAHKNPFIYLVREKNTSHNGVYDHSRRLAKLTIFPIIPSFTYSFRF